MNRFTVEQTISGLWWVRDLLHERFGTPVLAVTAYFKSRLLAETICNIMNVEWLEHQWTE